MFPRMIPLLAAGLIATAPIQGPPAGDTVLRAARQAIGGEARLAAVRSLVLEGHTRNLIGSTGKLSDPRPVQIRILLPAHYVRMQTNASHIARSGFAGDDLLNSMTALRPGDDFGASYGPEQIAIERVAFVRLMLALLAQTTAVMPLTARPVSADSVHLLGPDGFSMLLEVDKATRLPVRLRHTGHVHFPQPGSTMPPPAQQAEIMWRLQDHREVNGVKLPHHIVRTSRDVTLQDTRFETIRVNPPLTPKDFRE